MSSRDNANGKRVAIVVVGGGGVGKSALTLSFMRNQFVEEYDPTIEDSYCKQTVIPGVGEVTIDITDTAGQEEYRGLWGDKFMRNGDGFLLVYSITSRQSLDELESFRDQILRAKDTDRCPMMIAGNKCDLKEYREVSTDEGRQFARMSNAVFLETSAKERINVEAAFFDLVREIQRYKGGPSGSSGNMNQSNGARNSSNGQQRPRPNDGRGGGCCVVL